MFSGRRKNSVTGTVLLTQFSEKGKLKNVKKTVGNGIFIMDSIKFKITILMCSVHAVLHSIQKKGDKQ